jgi:DNA-binding Lrp family transcriptional regulator
MSRSWTRSISASTSRPSSKGKLLETQKRIAQDPHVAAVYDVTGDWDSFILGRFTGREDLNGFIKGLLAIPHVDRTVTHLVLNVVKEDPRVPV